MTSPSSNCRKQRGRSNARQRASEGRSAFSGALAAIGHVILGIARLWKRGLSRAPKLTGTVSIVLALTIVAGIGYGADGLQHSGRIYENVSIGGIDVGGMSEDDAVQAVAAEYEPRLHASGITVYASQQAMAAHQGNESTDDTVSVDEEKAATNRWQTDADALQASIDYQGLVDQAYQFGRQGAGERLQLRFNHQDVSVRPYIDTQAVESLASSIDESLGKPYKNWGVAVSDGKASVTEGYDGNMVDRDWFSEQIELLLASDPSVPREFVAQVQYAPVQIDQVTAQATCDKINGALSSEVSFTCNEASWEFSPETLGKLVSTSVEQDENGAYELAAHIDIDKAKRRIVQETDKSVGSDDAYKVSFERADDGVYVNLDKQVQVPNAQAAAEKLDQLLFDSDSQGGDRAITVEMQDVPQRLSFDDALSAGIITDISSYTTEYTARAEARNWNIHLAADTIDNSVIGANGGTWSFNHTTGERTEQAGYKTAGVVVGNTTSEDYGGGICQVATTIFNAVYEGGYPVLQRRNHSIYMAGYPAGRDAAVSWTSPDLQWQNDSTSDVLLKMSYTDTTVTATLYGIDPGYSVSTQTSAWEQGEAYKTVYENDGSLSSGEEYVKKSGKNGRSITVTRTVKDASGNVLHTDTFTSHYLAQDQVVARGTA